MTILRAEGIHVSIKGTPILRDVSMWIEANEWVTLVGPSGSGKTTLLHVLALLDLPSSGRIMFEGALASDWSNSERARARVDRIGLVFQESNLLDHLTGRENIALPAWLHHGSRRRALKAADALLERFGLRDRADTQASALSMGEAQRIAIARALVNEPKIVLLDEPTGSLDAASGATVLDVLDEARAAGSTLFVVTHSAELAARATRVLTMRDGSLTSA